ncbi:MAG: hypothetical protein ACK5KQ_00405 [Anaerorhabdus sp.]
MKSKNKLLIYLLNFIIFITVIMTYQLAKIRVESTVENEYALNNYYIEAKFNNAINLSENMDVINKIIDEKALIILESKDSLALYDHGLKYEFYGVSNGSYFSKEIFDNGDDVAISLNNRYPTDSTFKRNNKDYKVIGEITAGNILYKNGASMIFNLTSLEEFSISRILIDTEKIKKDNVEKVLKDSDVDYKVIVPDISVVSIIKCVFEDKSQFNYLVSTICVIVSYFYIVYFLLCFKEKGIRLMIKLGHPKASIIINEIKYNVICCFLAGVSSYIVLNEITKTMQLSRVNFKEILFIMSFMLFLNIIFTLVAFLIKYKGAK